MKSRLDRAIMSGKPTAVVVTLSLAEVRSMREQLALLTKGLALGEGQPVRRLDSELWARLEEAENPLRNARRF